MLVNAFHADFTAFRFITRIILLKKTRWSHHWRKSSVTLNFTAKDANIPTSCKWFKIISRYLALVLPCTLFLPYHNPYQKWLNSRKRLSYKKNPQHLQCNKVNENGPFLKPIGGQEGSSLLRKQHVHYRVHKSPTDHFK